ncbi:MAG: hypothetical protein LBO80_00575 [Treponema sp.]|nr:hypothetical protein [Treponema sp.]
MIVQFFSGNTVQGYTNDKTNSVLAASRYSISGNRLAIAFNSDAGGDWQIVAGKTYVYTIDDGETFRTMENCGCV